MLFFEMQINYKQASGSSRSGLCAYPSHAANLIAALDAELSFPRPGVRRKDEGDRNGGRQAANRCAEVDVGSDID